jgi:hypothetical protein
MRWRIVAPGRRLMNELRILIVLAALLVPLMLLAG